MINYTLAQLNAFLAVAETGSFRRAASELCITQSAVSTRVQELEKQIGVKLFHRTTRSVQLTPQGDRFAAVAERALADVQEAVAGLHEEAALKRGRVAIACQLSVAETFLPLVMQQFQQAYPGIKLELRDLIGDGTIEHVLSGRCDFGISTPVHGNAELEFEELFRDDMFLVVRADHPLAGRKCVALKETASYDFVGPRENMVLRRTIDDAFARARLSFKPRQEAFNVQTTLRLVEAGFGIAFIPEIFTNRINAALCRKVPLNKREMFRILGVLTVRGRSLSPAASSFKDLLKTWIKKNKR